MLRYCHDISNIKQYDDNTVILYLYFPAAVAFRNKSEASMQCACENTHTLSVQTCQVFFPRCWSTLSWRAGSHPFGPFSLNQWLSAILKQCDTIVSTSVLFPSSFQAFKRNKKAPLLWVSIKMPKRWQSGTFTFWPFWPWVPLHFALPWAWPVSSESLCRRALLLLAPALCSSVGTALN